jgi:predicted nucleotide-binding protein
MARRPSASSSPQPANLSVDQMRFGVIAIKRRIADLEAFDPSKIPARGHHDVSALEKRIEETLSDLFGHDTTDFHRYREAASLDNGPHFISAGFGPARIEPFQDYLRDGKAQALALLQGAVTGLEERIKDREELAEPTGAPANAPRGALDLSKVFIVHGHDGAPKADVARFIEKLGFEAIILHERPNKGRTLITKFREEAEGVRFAVVLMTPDDLGKALSAADLNARARQNVIFELGFFIGKLGSERVAALVKGEVERPSDFDGVVYISLDKDDWRVSLGKELKEAGYKVDWNKVMS